MIEINVCIGTSCHLRGSLNIIHTFQQLIEEHQLHEKIELKGSFCMKGCNQVGVRVNLNGDTYSVDPEAAYEFFGEKILTIN